MYSQEEKVLILGSLFHDIGKFVQRCYPDRVLRPHPVEGKLFLEENLSIKEHLTRIIGSEEHFLAMLGIILNHHKPTTDIEKIVQAADRLSASERELLEANEEDPERKWENKHLCSVFSKLKLMSSEESKPRYFNHRYLIDKNYEELIPASGSQDSLFSYDSRDLENFRNDLEQILSFYEVEDDFSTIVNLILILFEKYLWCIPDFTGNPQTDISLFNHSKDVSGLSLALHKSVSGSKKLNLIVGDIPGIQDYIFDLYSTKRVAKTLRGRSIFVQVLSRNFATVLLEELGLTECNLVMLAGGKFYIIAPCSENFSQIYEKANNSIEKFLWDNFNAEMSFNSAYADFDYEDLMNKKITFGSIVEKANDLLLRNRKKLFSQILFPNGEVDEAKFVFNHEYIIPEDLDSNNIKCKLTNKPIPEGKHETLDEVDSVLKQAHLEYSIGDEIPDDNMLVEIERDGLTVRRIFPIRKFEGLKESRKILLNPDLDTIINVVKEKKDNKLDFLRNTRVIEVANYVRMNERGLTKEEMDKYEDDQPGNVMTFAKLASQGEGVNYLALIKGDIDNLGMLMALGLDSDVADKSLSAISRTTTMSNHLKYFFSFYLNNFLKEHHSNTYTIFAGGDDLMLITPQSDSINLIDSLNKKFESFACYNKEVHASYSITHFKDHTPIKLVNVFADENQEYVKKKKKGESDELKSDSLNASVNKASTLIFESKIKNSELQDVLHKSEKMIGWVRENDVNSKKGVSMGVLRNLLSYSEMMKGYRANGDTRKLMWHPLLSYSINRNLMKNGEYLDQEVGAFFENVLKISKNEEEMELERLLYPVLCDTIFKLRSSKK